MLLTGNYITRTLSPLNQLLPVSHVITSAPYWVHRELLEVVFLKNRLLFGLLLWKPESQECTVPCELPCFPYSWCPQNVLRLAPPPNPYHSFKSANYCVFLLLATVLCDWISSVLLAHFALYFAPSVITFTFHFVSHFGSSFDCVHFFMNFIYIME